MNALQLPTYKRDITNTILQRLRESAQFIQVITGPRQVGKTTSIRQVLADVQRSEQTATPKWSTS